MQHLDARGRDFAEHGAKLYLDQVLAKKAVLGAKAMVSERMRRRLEALLDEAERGCHCTGLDRRR